MDGRAIVDTGYLVALLNRDDEYHGWAKGLLGELRGPWVTAEACISEVVFLLEHAGRACVESLCSWIEKDLLLSVHFLPDELQPIRAEMLRYRRRWVDFADACLVRLSDQHPQLPVVTVDKADFSVFFRHRTGRKLLLPY
jgi:predicted nucleic acid-binding protein